MARPAKPGLGYFPLDVGFLGDKKVKLLRAEFGASSVVFVLYVLSKAYGEDGYFLRWDKDECLCAVDEIGCGVTPTYISEVLKGCLSRSIFDDRVFQVFGVLTSAGIQRRYLKGCEKRDDIAIFEEYFLLEKTEIPKGILSKITFKRVKGVKNEVNSPFNSVNSPFNPESKVKESKEKKSKEESSGKGLPSLQDVEDYCREQKINIEPSLFYNFYEAKGWRIGLTPIQDWRAILKTWELREQDKKRCERLANGHHYTKEELESMIDDIEDIEF